MVDFKQLNNIDNVNKSDVMTYTMVLQIVRWIASILSAIKLIPNIDDVTFIGKSVLQLQKKLALLGGKVAVPTTPNSQSMDRRRWEHLNLGIDLMLVKNPNAGRDNYLELGCELSFNLHPIFTPSAPSKGDQILL